MAMVSSAHRVWCKVSLPDGYSFGQSHSLAGDVVIKHNKTNKLIAVCSVQYDCSLSEKRYVGMLIPVHMADPRNAIKYFNVGLGKTHHNKDPQELVMQLCVIHRMEIN